MAATQLFLVRHGQTIANKEKIWHGQVDTPLNEEGERQRQSLGAYFDNYTHAEVIVSSTLQRARLTAESIALPRGIELNHYSDLKEFYIGEWELQPYEALLGDLGFFENMQNDENYVPPGGESRKNVADRFCGRLESLAGAHQGKNIVVVAHGMGLSFMLSQWLHGDSSRWVDYRMDNTAVTQFEFETKTMVAFNQLDHLNG